jgi:DNA-binding NtrC family response regulator
MRILVVEDDDSLRRYVRAALEDGGFSADEAVCLDDIADMRRLALQNLVIPKCAGVIFLFSVGWRKGYFYDLRPLRRPKGVQDQR